MQQHDRLHCETCPSRALGVFCQLPAPDVQQIDARKVTNHYRRRQVLFYEGQNPSGLFCIASGGVKLYKTGGDGRSLIVRTAKSGDLAGYRALLSGEHYEATAEMTGDGDVCFIDRATIDASIRKNPSLAMNIIRKLGGELGQTETRLREFSQKSVRERLAELLLVFKAQVGKPAPGGGTLLDQRMTREEMAQMLGSTPETVIRLLHALADGKLLRLTGKQIIITDVAGLTREAKLDN